MDAIDWVDEKLQTSSSIQSDSGSSPLQLSLLALRKILPWLNEIAETEIDHTGKCSGQMVDITKGLIEDISNLLVPDIRKCPYVSIDQTKCGKEAEPGALYCKDHFGRFCFVCKSRHANQECGQKITLHDSTCTCGWQMCQNPECIKIHEEAVHQ